MALQHSDIYLFNVPWTKGDGNLLLFNSTSTLSSREVQANAFLKYIFSTSNYSGNNYNIIKEGVLKLPVNSYSIQNYNYLMFKNDDLLRPGQDDIQYWYAYVDSVEWLSYNSCAVHYTLDAWQNFQHEINFDRNVDLIRGHILKDDDVIGGNIEPEPIGFNVSDEKEISPFDDIDWDLQWVLLSKSRMTVDEEDIKHYEYGGSGTYNSLTGLYGFFVDTNVQVKKYLEQYQSDSVWSNGITDVLRNPSDQNILLAIAKGVSGTYTDHRDDLIGLAAVPKWAKIKPDIPLASGIIVEKEASVSIDQDKLPNNYPPKNKKLLSSLYHTFILMNYNGFQQALKPEQIKGSTLNLKLSCCSQPEGSYKCKITNYKLAGHKTFTIPYNASTSFAYNGTQGNEWRNLIGGATGLISSVGATVGGFASGNVVGGIQGAESIVQSSLNLTDSIAPRGVSTGSSSNRLDCLKENAMLRVLEACPSVNECQAIDDYLSKYGYAINHSEILSTFMHTRSKWNFIQVRKMNCKISAPDEYAQVIKSNFENGCTIWHTSIANVGDYSGTND